MACFILLEINTIFYREEDDNDHHHIVLYSSRGGNEVNYVAQFDFTHLCKCKKM